jgi:PAS domain S-box-containing protein
MSELEQLRFERDQFRSLADDLRRKYTVLFDFAPSAYLTLDKDHKIKEINQKGSQILGIGKSTITGKVFDDYITAGSLDALQNFYRQLESDHDKEFCELDLRNGDGKLAMVFMEGRYCVETGDILLNIIDVSGIELSALLLQQTRQNYEIFFNTIEEFLYVMEPSGKIIYTNTTVREKLGYNDSDIADLTFEKLHPSGLRNAAVHCFHSMLEGREKLCNLPLICKSGTEIPVETRLSHGDWNGRPAIFAISKDMSSYKLAEQILRISETKYRTMLNASPDGILLVGMDGIISEISELGLELLGAETRNNIIGKSFAHIIPENERYIVDDVFEKTITDGLIQNTEIIIKRLNQTLFSGEISATLIQSAEGTPIAFLLIVRDITQRKKTEAKQIHADRMANLGEMASGIAHEINQPLNIISMILDKIIFDSDRNNRVDINFIKEKSERIFENITRIRNIIDHIRAFSRSHDDYVLTTFDINLAVEKAVSMTNEQLKHLGINLSLNLAKDLPGICGNIYKFEQVIVNLLVNAKDALIEKKNTIKDFSNPQIGIISRYERQKIIVEVTDNGIGIKDDDLSNVILPFYTTKAEGKGTGLGLSICYQIVKEMNGTIDIKSSRARGTEICITLDLKNQR